MSDQPPYIPPIDPTLPKPEENSKPQEPVPTSSLAFLIKNMGGPKAISTVFGMLLLAGGVGAGILLVSQPELLNQKAATVNYSCAGGCGRCEQDGGTCTGTQPSCKCVYSPTCSFGGCGRCEQDGGTCTGTQPSCKCVYSVSNCTKIKCVKGPMYKRNSYCKGKNYISEYFYNMKCPTGYEKCAGDPVHSYDTIGTSQSCKDKVRCAGVVDCPSSDYTCYLPGTAESMCQYLPVN